MKFPDIETDVVEPRFASTSWRNECKSVPADEAAVAIDEPLPASAIIHRQKNYKNTRFAVWGNRYSCCKINN